MTSQLGGRRTFAFDAVDNVTKITDRLGRSREFVYDNLDRTTSEVSVVPNTAPEGQN